MKNIIDFLQLLIFLIKVDSDGSMNFFWVVTKKIKLYKI